MECLHYLASRVIGRGVACNALIQQHAMVFCKGVARNALIQQHANSGSVSV
jgi:hypothetical protein